MLLVAVVVQGMSFGYRVDVYNSKLKFPGRLGLQAFEIAFDDVSSIVYYQSRLGSNYRVKHAPVLIVKTPETCFVSARMPRDLQRVGNLRRLKTKIESHTGLKAKLKETFPSKNFFGTYDCTVL